MKKYFSFLIVAAMIMTAALSSCEGPEGPEGPRGEQGPAATITINAEGFWVINGVATTVRATGAPGTTPTLTINADGFWVINGETTTIKAEGSPGQQGLNSYLVIFDSDGGTPLFRMTGVLHGGKVTAPAENPKKSIGDLVLDFVGWYETGAATTFDFNTPITDNITLTAKWINPYFAKWVADWDLNYSLTLSANYLRVDYFDIGGYYKVSPLTWTAVVNTNPETKDDYPMGYKIKGVVSEDVGAGYGEDTWGGHYAFFIHKDENSIIEQDDDNGWYGVYTKVTE